MAYWPLEGDQERVEDLVPAGVDFLVRTTWEELRDTNCLQRYLRDQPLLPLPARGPKPDKPPFLRVSSENVIVTGLNPVVTVFKAATGTIPIVAFMLDPLQAGLVTNLHRPGGNLTGITLDAGIEIWGKRLEFLKEAIPSNL